MRRVGPQALAGARGPGAVVVAVRVDVGRRTMRRVTVWHRPDQDEDEWCARSYDATWQNVARGHGVSNDGHETASDSVVVQIPEDQHARVRKGDWVSPGELDEDRWHGTEDQMREAMPDGALRVYSVSDRTGGIRPQAGVMRLASCLVVSAQ